MASDSYIYRAYGKQVTGPVSPTNPFSWVGRFGYSSDAELEQYYVRERHYDPVLARWLSADPIGYRGGVNLLEYVKSRPSASVDPMGLWAIPIGGITVFNCEEGSFPIVGAWGGPGPLAAGISIDVVARRCDCCGPTSGFVKQGWVEGGLTGTITVGGGWGIEAVILGVRLEFGVHFAEATFTMVDITGVSNSCGDSSINMSQPFNFLAGGSVGGAVLPFGVSIGAGINLHGTTSAYVSTGGFGASYSVGIDADVWWTYKIFIEYKFHFDGYPMSLFDKSGGVSCAWAWPLACTVWAR